MNHPHIYALFDNNGEYLESCHTDSTIACALAVNGAYVVRYSPSTTVTKLKAFERTLGMHLNGDVEIEITTNTDGFQLLEWIRTAVYTRVQRGDRIRVVLSLG